MALKVNNQPNRQSISLSAPGLPLFLGNNQPVNQQPITLQGTPQQLQKQPSGLGQPGQIPIGGFQPALPLMQGDYQYAPPKAHLGINQNNFQDTRINTMPLFRSHLSPFPTGPVIPHDGGRYIINGV